MYKGSLNVAFCPGAARAARGEGSHAKDSRGEALVSGSPRTLAVRRRALKVWNHGGLRTSSATSSFSRRPTSQLCRRKPECWTGFGAEAGILGTRNRIWLPFFRIWLFFFYYFSMFFFFLLIDLVSAAHYLRPDRLTPEISWLGGWRCRVKSKKKKKKTRVCHRSNTITNEYNMKQVCITHPDPVIRSSLKFQLLKMKPCTFISFSLNK